MTTETFIEIETRGRMLRVRPLQQSGPVGICDCPRQGRPGYVYACNPCRSKYCNATLERTLCRWTFSFGCSQVMYCAACETVHYITVGVALQRPPAVHQYRRYAVAAHGCGSAELVALQMAACTSVMPVQVTEHTCEDMTDHSVRPNPFRQLWECSDGTC